MYRKGRDRNFNVHSTQGWNDFKRCNLAPQGSRVLACPTKHLQTAMQCLQVPAEEQKHVLGRRKGNTLSRRSIMKSYKPAIAADQNVLQLDGVADIRKVSTLPIYTVGSCTVQVYP